MTTASVSSSVGHGLRSLRSGFKLPSNLPFIRTAGAVANISRSSFQGFAPQFETRFRFHSASRRPNLPYHSATPPTPSLHREHLLQQRSRLCRNLPWVGYGSPPSRRGRHSYRRFDDDEFGTRGYRWTQLMPFWRSYWHIITGGGALCIVFYVTHLEPAPITGRRRFIWVSEARVNQLGEETYRETLNQMKGKLLPPSHPNVRVIQGVLDKLIAAAAEYEPRIRNWKWELHVIAENEQNAFVAPGGKVFVYTGILPYCKDEAGVAAVLGHEISHVLLNHHGEKLSSDVLSLISIWIVSHLFSVPISASSIGYDLLFNLPNSRKHESEADRVGLMIMARSCYDPQSTVKFWTRMSNLPFAPSLLSTHPSPKQRLEDINNLMVEAQSIYNDSGCFDQTPFNIIRRRLS